MNLIKLWDLLVGGALFALAMWALVSLPYFLFEPTPPVRTVAEGRR